AQAEALDSMLKRRNIRVTLMLNIDVETNELVKRLLNRGKTSGRSDDNLKTIHQRIQVYETKTLPVIQFYDRQNKHHRIKGTGTMDEVFADICKAIDSVYKK
ncbi:MAG: nucleoside monophosphate kinase, partial [Paludibacteraceae bacterium]|nr:nucleoside monophosphate kinase [Paludibacteraceae bacterium]